MSPSYDECLSCKGTGFHHNLEASPHEKAEGDLYIMCTCFKPGPEEERQYCKGCASDWKHIQCLDCGATPGRRRSDGGAPSYSFKASPDEHPGDCGDIEGDDVGPNHGKKPGDGGDVDDDATGSSYANSPERTPEHIASTDDNGEGQGHAQAAASH